MIAGLDGFEELILKIPNACCVEHGRTIEFQKNKQSFLMIIQLFIHMGKLFAALKNRLGRELIDFFNQLLSLMTKQTHPLDGLIAVLFYGSHNRRTDTNHMMSFYNALLTNRPCGTCWVR